MNMQTGLVAVQWFTAGTRTVLDAEVVVAVMVLCAFLMTDEYNERVKSDRGRTAGRDSNNQTPRGSKEVRQTAAHMKTLLNSTSIFSFLLLNK